MPSQLSRGFTFQSPSTANPATSLNQLVDNGRILPGAILEQVSGPPTTDDSFLYADGTSGGLKRCTLQQIIGAIPANSPASTAALRRLGAQAQMAAPGDDSRFPTNLHGIRLGNGAGGADSVALPKDLSFDSFNLHGHTEIDWDIADVFYEDMGANKTYTFTSNHLRPGRNVLVVLKTNGHTVTWPTLLGDIPETTGNSDGIYYIQFTRTELGTSGYLLNGAGNSDDDSPTPSQLLLNGPGTRNIDWSLSDTFYLNLGANVDYTFSNTTDGQTIRVILVLNGHTVTFPSATYVGTVGTGTTYACLEFTKSGLGVIGTKTLI